MTDNEPGDPVRAIAGALSDQRDELILDMVALTRRQVENLHFEWPMMILLEASITENIVTGLNYLENNTDIASVQAPTSALSYARELAQRDVPLSALSRAYRLGYRRFLDYAETKARELDPHEQAAALSHLVDRSMKFVDKVVFQVEIAYERERDRWMSSRGGLRQRWLARILDGDTSDLAAIEQALGYRLDGTHIALQMWPDHDVPSSETMRLVDDASRAIAPHLDAIGIPLLAPVTDREVRIWFHTRSNSPAAATTLERALGPRSKLRLAVGLPGPGVAGFRRTMAQADLARRIAVQAGPHASRVLPYSRVTPLALMLSDLDELKAFASAALGQLAGTDPRNELLRETLHTFLARERSYAATAEALGRHRNTIGYRIQQAIELCGHNLDDPDARFDVEVALYIARWLGPAVLTNPPSVTTTTDHTDPKDDNDGRKPR